jgi:ligand-binding sensor domain-containing protein
LRYFKKDSLLNTYKTCYAVQEDNLWTGTYGDGVLIKNGKNVTNLTNKNTRSTPQRDDGLVSDYITCITFDEARKNVWIGTNSGLCRCDYDYKEWTRFLEGKELPNNVIRALAVDNSGNVWVGTPSGISIFDGENWKTVNETNGLLQGSIHSIKVKGNTVWVGTVGGSISRYKDGQWETIVGFD